MPPGETSSQEKSCNGNYSTHDCHNWEASIEVNTLDFNHHASGSASYSQANTMSLSPSESANQASHNSWLEEVVQNGILSNSTSADSHTFQVDGMEVIIMIRKIMVSGMHLDDDRGLSGLGRLRDRILKEHRCRKPCLLRHCWTMVQN
jgi:hypothetical protein